MKKLFFLAFLLGGIVLVSKAQFISRGSVIGSGSILLRIENIKNEFGASSSEQSSRAFTLNPFAGYFIMDNLAVGLGMDVSFDKGKMEDGSITYQYNSTGLTISPVVRYYISGGLFTQGNFGIGSVATKSMVGQSETESKFGSTNWRVGAGYSIKITDTILLDPLLSYGAFVRTNKEDSDFKITNSGFRFGLSFTLVLID